MGGSWPKFFLMTGALDSGKSILLAALIVSSVLNVVYLIPIAIRGFMRPPADPEADAKLAAIRAQHKWVIIPPVFTALGALVLFFFADPMIQFLSPMIPGGF